MLFCLFRFFKHSVCSRYYEQEDIWIERSSACPYISRYTIEEKAMRFSGCKSFNIACTRKFMWHMKAHVLYMKRVDWVHGWTSYFVLFCLHLSSFYSYNNQVLDCFIQLIRRFIPTWFFGGSCLGNNRPNSRFACAFPAIWWYFLRWETSCMWSEVEFSNDFVSFIWSC